jgi:iron(III) transport system substrate-binding protein
LPIAQIPLHPGVETPPQLKPIETIKAMRISYAELAGKVQAIQSVLKDWAGF